jgi:hypothetical protein
VYRFCIAADPYARLEGLDPSRYLGVEAKFIAQLVGYFRGK